MFTMGIFLFFTLPLTTLRVFALVHSFDGCPALQLCYSSFVFYRFFFFWQYHRGFCADTLTFFFPFYVNTGVGCFKESEIYLQFSFLVFKPLSSFLL